MKKTLVAFALGAVIGMAIGPALAGAYTPDPAQDSTRALQDIASTLKARENNQETYRTLQNISQTLKSIDSTLKRR